MRQRHLNCFEDFHCLAGACSDTCCAGWEIDLDPEILRTYETLPGALGEEVRSRITEEDGYTFFRCQNGKCPFLDEHLLCRLITAAEGEQTLLSEVCREHPRFHEEYDAAGLRETCLAISCPEAARLLLESGPVQVITEEADSPEDAEAIKACEFTEDTEFTEDAEASGTPDSFDTALLALLEREREKTLRLVYADLPFAQRLGRLMDRGRGLQRKLGRWLEAEANGLPEETEDPEMPEVTTAPEDEDLRHWLEALQRMEFTDDRLPRLLNKALTRSGPLVPVIPKHLTVQAENLTVYFLYRYFLKAAWDEDLLGKVGLAVRSVQTIFLLAPETGLSPASAALTEAAIRFSREVEHSDENLSFLYDSIWDMCPIYYINMQHRAGYTENH